MVKLPVLVWATLPVFKGALTVTGIVPDGSVQAKVKYPAERVKTKTAAMRGRDAEEI
jgi:hypothetical protein